MTILNLYAIKESYTKLLPNLFGNTKVISFGGRKWKSAVIFAQIGCICNFILVGQH